jgi:hypothetical protein
MPSFNYCSNQIFNFTLHGYTALWRLVFADPSGAYNHIRAIAQTVLAWPMCQKAVMSL